MKRLLVIHRFPIVRYGLIKLVDEYVQDVYVSEAGTVTQALQCVRETDWDLVVMGLSFGSSGGLELLKAIKDLRPQLLVIVLSSHAEELYARRSFAAGAAGYVTKDSSRAEVVHAIREVMSGGRYRSAQLAETPVVGPRVAALRRDRTRLLRKLAMKNNAQACGFRRNASDCRCALSKARAVSERP
jgi:DNA-binding NarL/FixJ family response regulator